MSSRPRRPTEAEVREAVLADLNGQTVVAEDLVFGYANIVGVCRLALDVREQRSKSVFQPTERVVERALGQMFLVICHRPPRDDEEFIPPDAEFVWAEEVSRRTGAIVIFATSAEDCRDRLRQRGLPL